MKKTGAHSIKSTAPPSTQKIAASKSNLVKLFLEMLVGIKLYHWNTHSFAQHKATDELYEKLDDAVDKFVEIMQGKMVSPNRIQLINDEIAALTAEDADTMTEKVLAYIEQLQNLNEVFSPTKDSDLLNIRDEMVGHLNQFLYLFTFD